jgi:hypothetical protein
MAVWGLLPVKLPEAVLAAKIPLLGGLRHQSEASGGVVRKTVRIVPAGEALATEAPRP